MHESLRVLIRTLLTSANGKDPLGGIDFFSLPASRAGEALRAFAAILTEDTDVTENDDAESDDDVFLRGLARSITKELDERYRNDDAFRFAVERAVEELSGNAAPDWSPEVREALWRVFFPEGAGLERDPAGAIEALRKRRTVTVEAVNPDPLSNPARELLFTSNVLITTPLDASDLETISHSDELKEKIRATMQEVQLYYYDHPIHIGVDTESNEAIYGMRGLNEAIAYEKRRGHIRSDATVSVVLSLSVTHEGLHTVAREYLEEEFKRGGPFEHLSIYLFTELECRQIVETVLAPWLDETTRAEVLRVFGVDGEYGRHYSFLKAIAAFWHVFVDDAVRGTFKIDLDQVFPQKALEEETGETALRHFMTPLWGATGRDAEGTPVELGMIAGALVNEKDIERGLFTPDVPFPDEIPVGEPVVFYNKLPMALSTEAEMMTRYNTPDAPVDGTTQCLQRYHVTGGTNGILVSHLRRHRPFTPTFVGRAEDQAYILSVLYELSRNGTTSGVLRYAHKPGLIMRHDKEAFAGASIKAAKHGRFIGDLARTWVYSRYAGSLPWGIEKTKEQIDPFTGCFVTQIPYTIIGLRLALYAAELLDDDAAVATVFDLAKRKLGPLFTESDEEAIGREYRRQREAWHRYYDALDAAEAALRDGDAPATPPSATPTPSSSAGPTAPSSDEATNDAITAAQTVVSQARVGV